MAPATTSKTAKLRGPLQRPAYRASRAFFLTLLIGACFFTYAILTAGSAASDLHLQDSALYKRSSDDVSPALSDDEQCRLVHRAKDQCAFVHAQCPDEEAGFTAYLDLYYCRLAHAKAAAFIILISWLGLLFSTIGIAASDFFCINLSTIATILGMSESMAGVTFLAFGNGSPDVFSTFAAMSTNSGSLAVGELFGAAGFITAVVSGSMALIRPFHVAKKSFVRDVGFFAVAAAFSLVFLWDGKLHFWECISMVVFYVFYVAFVMVWHWWLGRRRRRREKEAAARGHFLPPDDELEIEEEYHDDPDESAPRPGVSRGVSREDWSALERGGDGAPRIQEPDEDDEEEARDKWMSELNSNMRLTRPSVRNRSNTTLTPVRPSLVGALEFQAVLKSLQKSRNIQTYPMDTRRYSDDPTFTSAQQQDHMSTISDPASRPPYHVVPEGDTEQRRPGNLEVPYTAPALGRGRAVSASDVQGLRIDEDIQQAASNGRRSFEGRQEEDLIEFGERDTHAQSQQATAETPALRVSPSPAFEFSPAPPSRVGTDDSARTHTSTSAKSSRSAHLLVPGEITRQGVDQRHFGDTTDSPRRVPSSNELPKIMIPRRQASHTSTPSTSPFPRYRDSPSPGNSGPPSINLPPPSIGSPESVPVSQAIEPDSSKRPSLLSRWWPYTILPPPGVMISTLFPTIYHWHDKNHWEKALGVVAAPSVFLLTITLPVVESGKDDEEQSRKDTSMDSARSKGASISISSPGDLTATGAAGMANSASVATSTEQNQRQNYGDPSIVAEDNISSAPLTEEPAQQPSPTLWNRWLLILQLFLAPIFIVLAIYTQSPVDVTPRWLLKPTVICLLVSLVLLIPLLLTTTPTHRPSIYRPVLSLAGFIVSIAWISTIAGQVVGALKALAVICNMSHAIMGLTIFAVGNSLGDLVADVTVAKLGYPVMALSACFGGPMLNILLGIGLSGSWILIRGANHRVKKHPDKDFKFKSYHIDVSNTLIVSGFTLLVTLVGLLIFVPMNRWVMSKKLGWALIAVWVVSTTANVVLELTGFAEDGSDS
ncbi:uncharacterized protein LTR77_002053 [Saxophila tyrrhenica]|uniref:Sodium/calcium exchanger membrane region domain-containing protein n=1 Tax=Saxophila tyrrhenica TaxID=1690608 RepID=A0AAV9PHW4_9PEZI|nr:hypothetical protein LTR77_002053 [Saxophila tyrrhenica]